MENKNTNYTVKNRSASMVIYNIPEMGIRREFTPGEIKNIPYEELLRLSYQAGGREIMANFLQIKEESLTDEFNITREPEYDMSEEQIIDLLKNGSLDAFMDALDFAPVGVLDLIKTFATQMPTLDMAKRTALKNKTGFDLTTVLANMEKEKEAEKTENTVSAPERRVKTETTTSTGRRTTTQYKVVATKE